LESGWRQVRLDERPDLPHEEKKVVVTEIVQVKDHGADEKSEFEKQGENLYKGKSPWNRDWGAPRKVVVQ
jgi:hypothetical protein